MEQSKKKNKKSWALRDRTRDPRNGLLNQPLHYSTYYSYELCVLLAYILSSDDIYHHPMSYIVTIDNYRKFITTNTPLTDIVEQHNIVYPLSSMSQHIMRISNDTLIKKDVIKYCSGLFKKPNTEKIFTSVHIHESTQEGPYKPSGTYNFADWQILADDVSTLDVTKRVSDVSQLRALEDKIGGPSVKFEPFLNSKTQSDSITGFDEEADIFASVCKDSEPDHPQLTYVYWNCLIDSPVVTNTKLNTNAFPELSNVMFQEYILKDNIKSFTQFLKIWGSMDDLGKAIAHYSESIARCDLEESFMAKITHAYIVTKSNTDIVCYDDIKTTILDNNANDQYIDVHLPRILRQLGMRCINGTWVGAKKNTSHTISSEESAPDADFMSKEVDRLISERNRMCNKTCPGLVGPDGIPRTSIWARASDFDTFGEHIGINTINSSTPVSNLKEFENQMADEIMKHYDSTLKNFREAQIPIVIPSDPNPKSFNEHIKKAPVPIHKFDELLPLRRPSEVPPPNFRDFDKWYKDFKAWKESVVSTMAGTTSVRPSGHSAFPNMYKFEKL